MLRFVVRKFGFLSTVLWTLLVIDLAVLALLVGSLGAFSGEDSLEPGARGSDIECPPSASTPAAADARPQGRPIPGNGAGDPAGPAAAPEASSGPGEAPLLCGPQEALIYSWRERVAVAADRVGHFTPYGGAGLRTGRPTDDSYDVLRDCSPELSFANSTTVRVDGGEPETAGAQNNAADTREASGGAMETTYRFGGEVEMAQSLRLVDEKGPGGPALEISYRLVNRSQESRTVGLRSLLNPPIWAAAPYRPAYRAPVIAERPLREGGRKNGRIVTECTMLGRDAGLRSTSPGGGGLRLERALGAGERGTAAGQDHLRRVPQIPPRPVPLRGPSRPRSAVELGMRGVLDGAPSRTRTGAHPLAQVRGRRGARRLSRRERERAVSLGCRTATVDADNTR